MVNVKDGWEQRPERFTHSHRHRFPESVPASSRQKWLIDGATKASQLLDRNVNVVIEEISDGFEFKFESYEDYAAFTLSTCGEMEGNYNHTHSHEFDSSTGCDQEWINAAETYLKALGIDYDIEMKGNTAHFKFNRFSDSVTFNALINANSIDALAEYGMAHCQEQFERNLADYKQHWRPRLDTVAAGSPHI